MQEYLITNTAANADEHPPHIHSELRRKAGEPARSTVGWAGFVSLVLAVVLMWASSQTWFRDPRTQESVNGASLQNGQPHPLPFVAFTDIVSSTSLPGGSYFLTFAVFTAMAVGVSFPLRRSKAGKVAMAVGVLCAYQTFSTSAFDLTEGMEFAQWGLWVSFVTSAALVFTTTLWLIAHLVGSGARAVAGAAAAVVVASFFGADWVSVPLVTFARGQSGYSGWEFATQFGVAGAYDETVFVLTALPAAGILGLAALRPSRDRAVLRSMAWIGAAGLAIPVIVLWEVVSRTHGLATLSPGVGCYAIASVVATVSALVAAGSSSPALAGQHDVQAVSSQRGVNPGEG